MIAHDEQKEIDLKIAELLIQVRILRERRNQLAPISRLPPELLAEIFYLCTPELLDSRSLRYSHVFVSVCRQWRNVGMEAPEIWSTIPTDVAAEVTEIFLARSRNSPLDIHVGCDAEDDAVHAVLSHIHRIRRLRLDTGNASSFLQRLRDPAPLLTFFANSTSNDGIVLPDDFLGLDSPRLSHLQLDVGISWNTMRRGSLVQGLTCLYMTELSAECFPTGLQLREALMEMPSLETLVIHSRDDWSRVPEPVVGRRDIAVTLAKLTVLKLSSYDSSICDLLGYFRVPFNASITLTHGPVLDHPSEPHPVLTFLEGHCTRAHVDERPSIRHLVCDIAQNRCITYRDRTRYSYTHPSPLLDDSHTFPLSNLSFNLDFIRPLRLNKLEVLDLRCWRWENAEILFDLCHAASELWLEDSLYARVVPALCRRGVEDRDHVGHDADFLFLPRLRRIRIDLYNWRFFDDNDLATLRVLMACRNAVLDRMPLELEVRRSSRLAAEQMEKLLHVVGRAELLLVKREYGSFESEDD